MYDEHKDSKVKDFRPSKSLQKQKDRGGKGEFMFINCLPNPLGKSDASLWDTRLHQTDLR